MIDLERKLRRVERCLGVPVVLRSNGDGDGSTMFVNDRKQSGLQFSQKLGTESRWERNLIKLHEAVYHARAKKKHELQGGKCSRCGKDLGTLGECNHIVHRAHGRDDSLSNLEIVCPPFSGGCDWHRKEHGQ